ncbi:unnamed protein product [Brassica oleracea]
MIDPLYTRGSNISIERSNLSTMEKGVPVELTRGSANWARVVEEIVKLEKKTFPKHESLAQTFDGELRKRNAGLLYVAADGETLGYVMYSWPSSLSASITKLAVKESCRRQGHGEALLRAAIDKCRSRKLFTKLSDGINERGREVPGRICTIISMLLRKIGQADLAMKLMHSKTGRMGGVKRRVKFRTLLQSFVTHF